jgi:uncharacterized membrane protein YccC
MIRNQEALCHELAAAHRAWLRDLSERLATVRLPSSTVWERSSAVRYLEEEFAPRFHREAGAVDAAADRLPAGEAVRVWALGELVEFLRIYLAGLVQLAQSGAAFTRSVNKFLRAFECWCREVEAIVGALPAEAVGPDLIRRFEQLPDGADAAVPV